MAATADRRLQRQSLAVLGQVVQSLNRETGVAWPSQQRIATALGLVRQNVNRAFRELEACGYIVRSQEPFRPGGKAFTAYRLRLPEIDPEPVAVTAGDYTQPVAVTAGDYIEPTVVTAGDSPPEPQVIHRNPVKENPEKKPSTKVSGRSAARPPKPVQEPRPRTTIPEDWTLPEPAIVAAMERGKLTREQVLDVAEGFVLFHRERQTLSAAWGYNWRTWLDQVKPGGKYRYRVEGGGSTMQRPRSATSNLGMTAEEMAAYVQTHPTGGWT